MSYYSLYRDYVNGYYDSYQYDLIDLIEAVASTPFRGKAMIKDLKLEHVKNEFDDLQALWEDNEKDPALEAADRENMEIKLESLAHFYDEMHEANPSNMYHLEQDYLVENKISHAEHEVLFKIISRRNRFNSLISTIEDIIGAFGSTDSEELLAFENVQDNERILLLKKLGILDLIREKSKGISNSKLSSLAAYILNINPSSAQPLINPMYSSKIDQSKNPEHNPDLCKKVKSRLLRFDIEV